MKKAYLGDSVYADIDNGMVKLTTENGMGASNTIFLEPEVVEALQEFFEAMAAEHRAAIRGNRDPHVICPACHLPVRVHEYPDHFRDHLPGERARKECPACGWFWEADNASPEKPCPYCKSTGAKR